MNKRDMNEMIGRANVLHTQLRKAVGEECMIVRSKRPSRRKVIRTRTLASVICDAVSTADIYAAYTALIGDASTRLTGSAITAMHIQSWLESQYGVEPKIEDVRSAMSGYRKAAGAAVSASA